MVTTIKFKNPFIQIFKYQYNNIIIKGDRMAKKNTSINIESEIMKAIKIRAAELEITQTELIERYLKEGLERDKKATTI